MGSGLNKRHFPRIAPQPFGSPLLKMDDPVLVSTCLTRYVVECHAENPANLSMRHVRTRLQRPHRKSPFGVPSAPTNAFFQSFTGRAGYLTDRLYQLFHRHGFPIIRCFFPYHIHRTQVPSKPTISEIQPFGPRQRLSVKLEDKRFHLLGRFELTREDLRAQPFRILVLVRRFTGRLRYVP